MVETAQAWGWSPTAMIRGARNPHKHHPADYNFAHAVKTILDEKCGHCGVPVWYAFSEDPSVGFTEDMQKCEACTFQEDQKKDREDRPGERYTVRAVPEIGYEELPTRAAFHEQMHKKAVEKSQRELKQREKMMADLVA